MTSNHLAEWYTWSLKHWRGLGIAALSVLIALPIARKALDLAGEQADLARIETRLAEAATERAQLRGSFSQEDGRSPVLRGTSQRPASLALRQRVEQAGSGFAHIQQFRPLGASRSGELDFAGFTVTVLLPKQDLERWLHGFENTEPRLVVDTLDARPGHADQLVATVTGRGIIDDPVSRR